MPPSSSSTSSSEAPRAGPGGIAVVVLATLVAIAAADLAINLLIRMPADPRQEPTRLQRYFDYGRSIEGKIRYLVRETDAASGPIAIAGWFPIQDGQPARAAPGGRLIAVYGQSMSHRVGDAVVAQDPSMTLRKRGGPGAPLGHSYEFFRRDRGQHQADVVVLGVVASGLRGLSSMTTMGWAFEVPAPYTYPRWILEGGELKAIQPEVQSLAELRLALQEPARWQRFAAQLRAHDLSHSDLLFDAGIADRSAVLRAARRGYGQRHQDLLTERYHDGTGFLDTDGILSVARAILKQFAQEARADGAFPVVLLFHDRGYGDDLYRALSGTLNQENIAFLSTHEIAPANEPASFLPDGHFRTDYDIVFARRLLGMLPSPQEACKQRKGAGSCSAS